MKNTKKKGFTIVELVIVIAVIGILSAILIPTFTHLVKNANDTKLQADLRNAYTAYVDAQAEHVGEAGLLGIEELAFSDGTTTYVYYSGKYYKSSDMSTVDSTHTYTVASSAFSASKYNGFTAYKVTIADVTP